MDDDLVEARHVVGHVVWLRFRDGTFFLPPPASNCYQFAPSVGLTCGRHLSLRSEACHTR